MKSTSSDTSSLERLIAKAASDYKLGLSNDDFAREHGGVEPLRRALFELVEHWEMSPDTQDQELSALAEKVISFIKEHNLKPTHAIPEKPFRFLFMRSLNPVEQDNLNDALSELRAANIIDNQDRLTKAGFDRIWRQP